MDERIHLASENFALAEDRDQFKILHEQLQKLRVERDEILARLKRRRASHRMAQPFEKTLNRIAADSDQMLLADTLVLRHCAHQVIQSIRPKRVAIGNFWDYQAQSYSLELELNPTLWSVKKVVLNNLDMGFVTGYEAVLRVLHNEPMKSDEVAAALEFPFTLNHVRGCLTRLGRTELVERTGNTKPARYNLSARGRQVARKLKKKRILVPNKPASVQRA